jgi:hypothetical protein
MRAISLLPFRLYRDRFSDRRIDNFLVDRHRSQANTPMSRITHNDDSKANPEYGAS